MNKLGFPFSYSVKDVFYAIKTGEGRVVYRLNTTVAVEFHARDKRYTQVNYHFNETDYSTKVTSAPHGAIFFQKQHSRDLVDNRHDFYSGGFRVNVKRDSYFEISTGSMRGGEVCSAGQCVFLPPFRGWKIGAYVVHR